MNIDLSENEELTRMVCVKYFFETFANRSQTYDLYHALGLTVFSNEVVVMQKLTKLYDSFRVTSNSYRFIII